MFPECMTIVERKARKEHKCGECRKSIERGDKYQYISGIWEGEPSSYKTCLSCAKLREKAQLKASALEYDEEFYPAFGELHYWIKEYEENEGVPFAA